MNTRSKTEKKTTGRQTSIPEHFPNVSRTFPNQIAMALVNVDCGFPGCTFKTGEQQPALASSILDSHTPCHAPQANDVDREAGRLSRVKLPTFNKLSVELWLSDADSQFVVHNIRNAENKRAVVKAALAPEQQQAIATTLRDADAAVAADLNADHSDAYERVKAALIAVFTTPESDAASKIIDAKGFGGKDIRQLGREWVDAVERRPANFIVKEHWLRLAGERRRFLDQAAPDQTMEELIEATARLFDTSHLDGDSSVPPINAYDDTSAQGADVNAVGRRRNAMWKRDAETRRGNAFPPSQRPLNQNGLCFYHEKFGAEARRCSPGCVRARRQPGNANAGGVVQ